MQRQLDTFNKLEELSNALFGGFRQSGGDESSNEVIDSLQFNAFQGAAKTIIKSIDWLIPSIPDIANQPWADVAPNLIGNIEKNGRFISDAVKDPKVRVALEHAIQVYGQALNEVYGIAQPVVDDLVTKFWGTINIMGEKSARGATNAFIDTVSAAVAEIPVVGGLVDLFIAGGKWFNAIASGVMAPTITIQGEVGGKAIYNVREAVEIGKKYRSEASKATSSVSSALSDFRQQSVPNIASKLTEKANSVKTAATVQGVDMLQQANNYSQYGEAALATGIRSAQLGNAVANGDYLGAVKHGVSLGVDSSKLGHNTAMTAGAVNKATITPKEPKWGHNPFMIGGGRKASKKKARNTSKRLLNSIHRFTKKMR